MQTKGAIISFFLSGMLALQSPLIAQTWQQLPFTYTNYTSSDKKVFASPLSNTVIMAYQRNANPSDSYISTDGGDNWQGVLADKPIRAALFSPNGNIFLATIKKYVSTLYLPDSLFRSSDGINWTNLGPYTGAMENDEGDFFVSGNGTLLFPNEDGMNGPYLKMSADNGVTWSNTAYLTGTSNGAQSVAASHSADTIIFGTYNSGAYYSHDGGASFAPSSIQTGMVGAASVLSNGDVYVAAGFSINSSLDGGVGYSAFTYNPWVAMSIKEFFHHAPSGKFFVFAVQGIFESTDCITWTNITGNIPNVWESVDMAVSKDFLFLCRVNDDNLYRYEITNATGSEEETSELTWSLFPNPAADRFQISGLDPKSSIVVMDVTGKEMFQSSKNGGQETVNTAQWPNGIYIVRVEKDKGSTSKRIIVNH